MAATVRVGTVTEARTVFQAIPEFDHDLTPPAVFDERLANPGSCVHVALDDAGAPIGFKAGYDRYRDGSWYSWLGGVVPEHRGGDVAAALLELQESWVSGVGYTGIYVKTRNRFKGMRILLDRSGYDIVAYEPADPAADAGLTYYKDLTVRVR